MAFRIKTVEYSFPVIASVTNNVLTNFTQITLNLPENTKSFISVVAKVYFDDIITATGGTITTKTLGLRLGAAAYTSVANANALTNSGENISAFWAQDFTSHFTTNWTGTSMTCDLQVTFNQSTGTTLGLVNMCAKLEITYQFDDAVSVNHLKTVWIPLNMPVGQIPTAKAVADTIPNLDTYLPEASKVYRDIWIEWRGNTLNIAGSTTTDHQVSLEIDSLGATVTGNYEASLASDRLTHYIWNLMSAGSPVFTTNATHDFNIWTSVGAVARHHHSQAWMCVTYEFNPATTTRIMNSLLIASDIPSMWGGSATEFQRISRTLWIQEQNITEQRIAAFVAYHQPSTITNFLMRVNSASFATYTGIGDVPCGSLVAMLRCENDIVLARGRNTWTFDIYATGATVRGVNSSILWMVNYQSDVPSQGIWAANHTVKRNLLTCGTAAAAISNITASVSIPIPESEYFITALGIEWTSLQSGTGTPSGGNIDVERLSGEGGFQWESIYADTSRDDPEVGVRYVYGQARDLFNRWVGDADTSRLSITTGRRWRKVLGQGVSAFDNIDALVTYHSITYTVSDTVSGSSGGTVNVDLHRAGTGERIRSTSRVGNGAVNITWFDNTEQLYLVARETDSLTARSNNFVAT